MIRISQGEKEKCQNGGKNYFGVVWISQVRGMNLPGTGQCGGEGAVYLDGKVSWV
jgi:hypothetical protein